MTLRRRKVVVKNTGISGAVFSLVLVYGYMGLSCFWAPNPAAAAIEFFGIILAMLPAFLYGYFLGSSFGVRGVLVGFGVIPVLFILQAGYNYAVTGQAMLIDDYSIRSLLGSIVCFTTPLILATYIRYRSHLVGFQFLISMMCVIVIQSRSALIIAVPATFYVAYRHSRKTFWGALCAAGLIAFVVALANADQLIGRFSEENTNFDISESVLDELAFSPEDRVDFDRRLAAFTSVKLFIGSPIIGAGYNSVLQTNESEYGLQIVSHGFIPGTSGELGAVGLALICLFFFRLHQVSVAVLGAAPKDILVPLSGFWSGLAAFVIYGFFHQTFEAAFFGIFAGVALGFGASVRLARGSTGAV